MGDRLAGKLCIVTGAARGIGKAIGQAFLDEGATILLTDIDRRTLIEAGDTLGCEVMELDVREETHWKQLFDRYPSVDVVVNNAGVT